jgi:hypothetical protein
VCEDPRMVEYGNGVGQVAGRSGSGGAQLDVGASIGQFVSNSAHTISTLPPAELLAIVVVVFLGLILLRRAF